MASLGAFCKLATTFSKETGEIDQEAFRQFLHRFIETKIGIYIASGGGGEGHSLAQDELRLIYQIGRDECKGKIPVYASPPEQYTARETRDYTLQAIEAGVDAVSVFALASRHGMRPTDSELYAYFDFVLAGIKHPIVLAVHQKVMGHLPKPEVVAEICRRHRQIVAVNLSHINDNYLVNIKDLVRPDIAVYVQVTGSLNQFSLGAVGMFGSDANIIPKTFRRYVDLYEMKRYDELGKVYADMKRFEQFNARWAPAAPRAIKMAMKLLKLPGGEGGVREPYQMPPPEEYKIFSDGVLRLGMSEIEDQARAAGLTIPV